MRVYSAKQVAVIFGGAPLDSDRGDDTFCEIEQMAEKFTPKAGVDGGVTMSEMGDETHKVTLTLMQSSNGNAILSAIYQAARLSKAGVSGVLPIVIKDMAGTSLLTSLESFLAGWPKRSYGKEVGTVAWTIYVANPERFEGGNSEV